MLAGNIHELGQARAGADVDGVETLFSHEFIDGDGASDNYVGLELNAHFTHVIELFADDLLGQAEFRDSINEHPAEFVQSLEHAYLVPLLNKIAGNREAGRTTAYDCNFFARGRNVGNDVSSHALLVVGNKALQIADSEGLHFFREQTLAFAVIFLRADASGNGGQNIIFANLRSCAEKVADHDQLHKFFYLHPYRTVIRAGGLGAFQAANSFLLREFWTVTEVHLTEVVGALFRGLFGHQLPRNLDALLHRQGI